MEYFLCVSFVGTLVLLIAQVMDYALDAMWREPWTPRSAAVLPATDRRRDSERVAIWEAVGR